MELLMLVAPNIKTVATMFNPTNVTFQAAELAQCAGRGGEGEERLPFA
jgi:hypothetical protein